METYQKNFYKGMYHALLTIATTENESCVLLTSLLWTNTVAEPGFPVPFWSEAEERQCEQTVYIQDQNTPPQTPEATDYHALCMILPFMLLGLLSICWFKILDYK